MKISLHLFKEHYCEINMTYFLVFSLISMIVAITLAAISSFAVSYEQESQPKIFLPGSSPYSIPFNQWIGKWWQWYVSVPKSESPNHPDYPNHISKVDCAIRQDPSSPVFFLFTPLVDEAAPNRTCDIPKDKAILLPIISGEADNGDPEQLDKSDQGMIQTAKGGNDYGAISIKLDDTMLNFNEDPKFRAISDFFNITLPEHNLWEEKEVPGTYKGITEGYFLFLSPLPLGNHTLYYEAGTNPPNPNVYVQAVTYHLNVK
jgi:hypothetical protein